ncbi:MAG TPA: aminopeptidase [Candidatus Acidoferrales bacterium]|nr:aminopeptidase [Candidatus Acidoferrales bacterium]
MNRHGSILGLLVCVALFVAALAACSPTYLFQMALEEGKILWRRQPIESLLEDGELDPGTADKLRLVLAVRKYARDVLHLRVGGSYATYSYVDRPVLSYVLMAAPKTDLKPYTWWYLFVGRVPYKGFASEKAAQSEADRFAAAGYDTYIREASAFSTLGWFDDPLLKHVLAYDKVTLADLIFHELVHNTLFVKGAVDFNESFANFVGHRAAIAFFLQQTGADSAEYRKAVESWEQALEFSRFIAELAGTLAELYARSIPVEDKLRLRQEIFQRGQEQWSRQIAERPAHRYRGFGRGPVNNAVIAHALLYLSRLDLFEALYKALGGDLRKCIELVAEHTRRAQDPFAAVQDLAKRAGAAAERLS